MRVFLGLCEQSGGAAFNTCLLVVPFVAWDGEQDKIDLVAS